MQRPRTGSYYRPLVSRRKFLAKTAIGSLLLSSVPGTVLFAQSASSLQKRLPGLSALVFDVFGTVVDWHTSIVREGTMLAARKGYDIDWSEFASRWRSGYGPAMGRVRRGELPWTRIDDLHRMILDELVVEYNLTGLSEAELEHFNRAWHRLIPWPDTVAGLYRLKSRYTIATLSNGNVSLLVNMARHAGLPWDTVFSAELSEHYKPDPEAYLKASTLLDLPTERVMLVAAHPGDLRAAAALGFKTAYVYRPLEQGEEVLVTRNTTDVFDIRAEDFLDLATQLNT
jgi:2-haloacid dehalogenase